MTRVERSRAARAVHVDAPFVQEVAEHLGGLEEQPGGGPSELSGTFWLLPCWMARHHGLIR